MICSVYPDFQNEWLLWVILFWQVTDLNKSETLLCVIYSFSKEKIYFCMEENVNKMDIVTEISANELELNPN